MERWPDSRNAFTFWYPANLDLATQVETWVVFRKLLNIGLYQSWPTFFLNNHQVGFFLKLFWGPHVLLISIQRFWLPGRLFKKWVIIGGYA